MVVLKWISNFARKFSTTIQETRMEPVHFCPHCHKPVDSVGEEIVRVRQENLKTATDLYKAYAKKKSLIIKYGFTFLLISLLLPFIIVCIVIATSLATDYATYAKLIATTALVYIVWTFIISLFYSVTSSIIIRKVYKQFTDDHPNESKLIEY